MSSDRQFAPRSFYSISRKRKSILRPIVAGVIVIGAGVACYVEFWPAISKWFEPKVEIIHSQDEALKKLQSLLTTWDGDTQKLIEVSKDVKSHINWIESDQAQESVEWLIATELDRRGAHQASEPLIITVLGKKLVALPDLIDTDKQQLLNNGFIWAEEFQSRGHSQSAETLYRTLLNKLPENRQDLRLKSLIALATLSNNRAGFKDMIAYMEQINDPKLLDSLSSSKDVKSIVNLLIQQDTIKSKETNQLHTEGTALAKSLLEKHRMSNSAEMGKIILNGLKSPLSSKQQFKANELKEMATQLEAALICFRATNSDMEYTPETLLALAQIKRDLGQLKEAEKLLSQAEGSAMTLGVDAPRILEGSSISDQIKTQRARLENVSNVEALVKKAYIDARLADSFVKAKNWEEATKYYNQALDVAKNNTKFQQALLPILYGIEANMFTQQEKYPESEGRYSYIIDTWDKLSEEDKAILAQNLQVLKAPDLYQIIHRAWADTCLKQNRTTEAKRVLAKINEELPKEEPKSNSSRRNNSRRNR